MTKIIHKLKLSGKALHLYSMLIILIVIFISFLPIHVGFKIFGYVICILVNYKLIDVEINGYRISDKEFEAWKRRRNS